MFARIVLLGLLFAVSACGDREAPAPNARCESFRDIENQILKERMEFAPDLVLSTRVDTEPAKDFGTHKITPCMVIAIDITMPDLRTENPVRGGIREGVFGDGELGYIGNAASNYYGRNPKNGEHQILVILRRFYVVKVAKPMKVALHDNSGFHNPGFQIAYLELAP